LEPEAWNAVADPETGPGLQSVASSLPVNGSVAFPKRCGTAVMYGIAIIRGVTVANLETGQTIGSIPKTKPIPPPQTLSPSGEFYVGRELGVTPSGSVNVWRTATGQVAHTLRICERFSPVFLEFVDHVRLLSLVCRPDQWNVGVWDVDTGQQVQQFEIPFDTSARFEAAAVSPGGRYLALLDRHWLHVYDIEERTCTGRVEVPDGGGQGPARGTELRFRSDGSELAALLEGEPHSRLICWDFATGRVALDVRQQSKNRLGREYAEVRGYPGPWLDWLPDGSGWLMYGHLIADRETGQINGKLESKVHHPRRLLGDGKMVIVHRPSGHHTDILEVVDMKISMVAVSSPTPPKAGSPEQIAWSAQPDSPVAPPKLEPPSGVVARGREAVRIYYPSRPSRFLAAVGIDGCSIHAISGEPPAHNAATWEPGPWMAQVDLSPDARYLAIRSRGDFHVRSLVSGETAFHVHSPEVLELRTIEFLSARELLLVYRPRSSNDLKLEILALDSGERRQLMARIGRARYGGQTVRGDSLRVSPGGKYLAALQDMALRVYDLSDGRCVGSSLIPPRADRRLPQDCLGMAFSQDGSRVGAVINYDGRKSKERGPDRLLQWNFADGTLLTNRELDSPQQQDAYQEHKSYHGRRIVGLPDDAGWLVHGHYLLDNDGDLVRELPKLSGGPRHFVGADHVVTPMVASDNRRWHVPVLSVDASPEVLEESMRQLSMATDDPVAPKASQTASRVPASSPVPGTTTRGPDAGGSQNASRPTQPKTETVATITKPAPRVPTPTAPRTTVPGTARRFESGGPASGRGSDSSWTTEADPPLVAPKIIRGGTAFAYCLGGWIGFAVPRHDSRYIVVREYDRDLNTLFDIDTGKPTSRSLDCGGGHAVYCVSADGRRLITLSGDRPTMMQAWSFESGELVSEFDVGARPDSACLTPDGSRLVVLDEVEDEGRVDGTIWEVDSGRKLGDLVLPRVKPLRDYEGLGLAISPGGRYVAVLFHRMLCVWELNTGRLVGRYTIPLESRYDIFNCFALQFTPEGDELAAIFTMANSGAQMNRWDLSTGQLVQARHLKAAQRPRGFRAPAMNWLPGHSFFLYRGTTVVEHRSGQEVYELKTPCERVVKLIDLDRLLVLRKTKEPWTELAAVRLPRDEIVTAVKTARSAPGQSVAKATRADTSGVRVVPPAQQSVPWSVEPDSLPTNNQSFRDKFEVSGTVRPSRLRVLPQCGKAYVLRTNWTRAGEGKNPKSGTTLAGHRMSLHVHDLTTGKETTQLPLPRGADLLDVSPDGGFILTRSTPEAGVRLDVWSVGQQPGHAVGWVPDSDVAARQVRELWGVMIDKQHVLTATNSVLTSWELPACRAGFQIRDFGEPVALSPQRKYLVAFHRERGCHVYDTSSGQCRGTLPLPVGVVRAVAFHPDGRSLIVLMHARVIVWDVAKGQVSVNVGIMPQAVASNCQWLDDRYVFFHSQAGTSPQFLFDVQKQVVVRQYSPPDLCLHIPHVLDNRIWYCRSRRISNDYASTLFAVPLPLDEERAACEATRVEDLQVAGPGTQVNLIVSNTSSFSVDLEGAARRAIEQSGLILDTSAQLRLELTLTEKETSELVEIKHLLDRSSKETISIKRLTLQRRLVDNGGKELWKPPDLNYSMYPKQIETGTKQEVAERLRGRVQERLDELCRKFRFPKHFFPAGEGLQVPVTNLPNDL